MAFPGHEMIWAPYPDHKHSAILLPLGPAKKPPVLSNGSGSIPPFDFLDDPISDIKPGHNQAADGFVYDLFMDVAGKPEWKHTRDLFVSRLLKTSGIKQAEFASKVQKMVEGVQLGLERQDAKKSMTAVVNFIYSINKDEFNIFLEYVNPLREIGELAYVTGEVARATRLPAGVVTVLNGTGYLFKDLLPETTSHILVEALPSLQRAIHGKAMAERETSEALLSMIREGAHLAHASYYELVRRLGAGTLETPRFSSNSIDRVRAGPYGIGLGSFPDGSLIMDLTGSTIGGSFSRGVIMTSTASEHTMTPSAKFAESSLVLSEAPSQISKPIETSPRIFTSSTPQAHVREPDLSLPKDSATTWVTALAGFGGIAHQLTQDIAVTAGVNAVTGKLSAGISIAVGGPVALAIGAATATAGGIYYGVYKPIATLKEKYPCPPKNILSAAECSELLQHSQVSHSYLTDLECAGRVGFIAKLNEAKSDLQGDVYREIRHDKSLIMRWWDWFYHDVDAKAMTAATKTRVEGYLHGLEALDSLNTDRYHAHIREHLTEQLVGLSVYQGKIASSSTILAATLDYEHALKQMLATPVTYDPAQLNECVKKMDFAVHQEQCAQLKITLESTLAKATDPRYCEALSSVLAEIETCKNSAPSDAAKMQLNTLAAQANSACENITNIINKEHAEAHERALQELAQAREQALAEAQRQESEQLVRKGLACASVALDLTGKMIELMIAQERATAPAPAIPEIFLMSDAAIARTQAASAMPQRVNTASLFMASDSGLFAEGDDRPSTSRYS